jgi:hypothetical protein
VISIDEQLGLYYFSPIGRRIIHQLFTTLHVSIFPGLGYNKDTFNGGVRRDVLDSYALPGHGFNRDSYGCI